MAPFLQAPIRPEERLVAPGHHVRGAGRDDAVAAGTGVGLVPAAQVSHGEVGAAGAGLGARHGGETVHAQGDVPLPVGALGSATCHAPITPHPAAVPKPKAAAGCESRPRANEAYDPSEQSGPVTLALNNLAHGSILADYGASMSGALIASVPTLAVYILLGKYFVGGLMAGSVKG